MWLRLLALPYLLFLSQGLLAQPSRTAGTIGIPGTCSVTKPYQTSIFVPPAPYEAKTVKTQFWFGTDSWFPVQLTPSRPLVPPCWAASAFRRSAVGRLRDV